MPRQRRVLMTASAAVGVTAFILGGDVAMACMDEWRPRDAVAAEQRTGEIGFGAWLLNRLLREDRPADEQPFAEALRTWRERATAPVAPQPDVSAPAEEVVPEELEPETVTPIQQIAEPTVAATPSPSQPRPAEVSAPTTSSGYGVPADYSLTAMAGATITQPGTVLDRADIRGQVTIKAPNVVIRNSRVDARGDTYGIYVTEGGSAVIENVSVTGAENGIAGDNWTARNVDLSGMSADGAKVGSNVRIENSRCHALTPGPGAHADCLQIQHGVNNVVIRGNDLDPSGAGDLGNAALFVAPDLGPSSRGPVVIENNTFGGGNFSVFIVDGDWGKYFINDITLRNNKFRDNAQYGPLRINVPVAQSNNVWQQDNQQVPVDRG